MATLSVDRPVIPLRQRMLDDMSMRRMGSRTQHDYVRHVRTFAGFLGRSPDTATAEDVRRFQLHQREHGVGEGTIHGSVSALRFLFGLTLDRADLSRRLVLAHCPRRLHTRPVMPISTAGMRPSHRRQTLKPIGTARGPRLLALEDIVCLPVSVILHSCGHSAALSRYLKPDIGS